MPVLNGLSNEGNFSLLYSPSIALNFPVENLKSTENDFSLVNVNNYQDLYTSYTDKVDTKDAYADQNSNYAHETYFYNEGYLIEDNLRYARIKELPESIMFSLNGQKDQEKQLIAYLLVNGEFLNEKEGLVFNPKKEQMNYSNVEYEFKDGDVLSSIIFEDHSVMNALNQKILVDVE